MKPYSEDLRWRVVRAVDRGELRGEVAERFEVSVPTIERWVRQRRETGGLAPKPVPGPAAVKTTALMAALPERLAEHADATLEEQCSWWQEVSGVEVSTATMSRALTRLGWTRKKVAEGERAEGGGTERLAGGRGGAPPRGSGLPG
jgi:transposase